MNGMPNAVKLGLLALLAGGGLVGCGSGVSAKSGGATPQTVQPVDYAVATKAQTSCWFKVANHSSESAEVRLWKASSSVGATTGRLGDLLIVSGAMEPAVRDARYYGCSLFEVHAGSSSRVDGHDPPNASARRQRDSVWLCKKWEERAEMMRRQA